MQEGVNEGERKGKDIMQKPSGNCCLLFSQELWKDL